MPELPEVETVARQLAPLVEGRRLRQVQVLDPLLRPLRAPRPYRDRRVERVFRSGKQVLFGLNGSSPLFLAVHLRMTGRLIWTDEQRLKPSHLRASLKMDRGQVLFIDTRRFGTIGWITDARQPLQTGGGGLAIDPTTEQFTAEALASLLSTSSQALKVWLLRQDRLNGLGNIYASEILYQARLSPRRMARTVRGREVERLHAATRSVLQRAIDACGTTFSDFQDAHGVTGSYQQYLAVYGREGEPCPSCRTEIRRIVQQQRSTFFCPQCQTKSGAKPSRS